MTHRLIGPFVAGSIETQTASGGYGNDDPPYYEVLLMVETTLLGLFIAWAVFWVGFLGLLMFWEWRHDSRRFPVYDRGGRSVRLFLDGREVRLPTDITLKELGYAYHQATRGKREANP